MDNEQNIPIELSNAADQYSATQKGYSPESDYSFGKVIGAYNGYIAGHNAHPSHAEVERLREALESIVKFSEGEYANWNDCPVRVNAIARRALSPNK